MVKNRDPSTEPCVPLEIMSDPLLHPHVGQSSYATDPHDRVDDNDDHTYPAIPVFGSVC